MQPDSTRRDRRRIALFAAPAFALALAACGGGDTVSSADTTAAPAAAEQANDTQEATTAAPDTAAAAETGTDDAATTTEAAPDGEAAETSPPERVVIPLLAADEAIANAEINQPTLQTADDVLDIETLAVGDGSVQTLRDVVDGDRPVLLWFFSPH